MPMKNVAIALLVTRIFLIPPPSHHIYADEPHSEERPSPAMPTPVASLSITGGWYSDRNANNQLPSDPQLIAMGNQVLKQWFEGRAKSQFPTAPPSQPRFQRRFGNVRPIYLRTDQACFGRKQSGSPIFRRRV